MAVHCCLYSWTDQTNHTKYYHRTCGYGTCNNTVEYDGHTWSLEKDTNAPDCSHCWTGMELPRATVRARARRPAVAAKKAKTAKKAKKAKARRG